MYHKILRKNIFIVGIALSEGDSGGPLWFQDLKTDPKLVGVFFGIIYPMEDHEEMFTTINEEILEFIHGIINM